MNKPIKFRRTRLFWDPKFLVELYTNIFETKFMVRGRVKNFSANFEGMKTLNITGQKSVKLKI